MTLSGLSLQSDSAGEVYREAGKLAEERHDEIAEALRAQLAKYKGPNGVMIGFEFLEGDGAQSRLAKPQMSALGQ